jgi:hypothetical protein
VTAYDPSKLIVMFWSGVLSASRARGPAWSPEAGREGFHPARQSKGRPKATGLFSTGDRAV